MLQWLQLLLHRNDIHAFFLRGLTSSKDSWSSNRIRVREFLLNK